MGKAYTKENTRELRRQALDALALQDAEAKCTAVWSLRALVNIDVDARLDVSPQIRHRLARAGDNESAAILDIILRDEVGHVAIGNHWYKWLCMQQRRDFVSTYEVMAKLYQAPRLRGPFNLEARREAGFDESELEALQRMAEQS